MKQSSSVVQHQPFQLLAALRIPAWQAALQRWRRGCRNKKEKKVWRNRNLQRWSSLHMFRQVPHPQKVRMHPKVQWHSWLRRKFESRMRRNSKSDAASSSQARLQEDAHLGGLMEQKRSQGMWTFPNLKLGDRMPIEQLRGNPLQQVNQTTGKSKSWKNSTVTQSARLSSHSYHTDAVFSITRKIYGREHDDPMDDLDVNMFYVGHISEYHSSSSSSSWTRPWGESTMREESFSEQRWTVSQWKWATDRWTKKSLV